MATLGATASTTTFPASPSDVGAQASDAELSAIAGLTSAADKAPYFTGSGTAALADLTSAARTVLDDTTVAAMVDTLGGASSTGTGGIARATSPTFVTPALGTPASGVATNLTGTASGLTAGNVTTNANLTGPVTSSGNATTIADAELAAIAGLTSANDRLPYFTGSGTASLATFTSAGRALVDDADAAAQRVTLVLDIHTVNFIIDGGGSTITTGVKGDIVFDYACTILQVTLLADQSGSIVIDLWKDTYANFPPVVGDSITASAKPTLSTATKSQDATLTGWGSGKSIAAGDTMRVNVDSIATCQRVTLSIKVQR